MGDEGEDGISRCGISGLYDAKGNPAALASGELGVARARTQRDACVREPAAGSVHLSPAPGNVELSAAPRD
jgi:hypothetical protein